jgi:hypothetical protein
MKLRTDQQVVIAAVMIIALAMACAWFLGTPYPDTLGKGAP